MTTPSDLGLETTSEECVEWTAGEHWPATGFLDKLLRDRTRLLTALSQARTELVEAKRALATWEDEYREHTPKQLADEASSTVLAREAVARKEEREWFRSALSGRKHGSYNDFTTKQEDLLIDALLAELDARSQP